MDCIAHRGFAAVAPENTITALEGAAETASMVEFDVRRCGSGELVVIHDDTVDRVTDASGRVANLDRSTLATLDVLGSGTGVPTLDEALQAVPEGTGLNVELKEQGLAADLVEQLAEYDHDVLVSSFDDEALREIDAIADLPLAMVFATDPASGLESARSVDAAAVHPQWELVSEAFVDGSHEAGFAVNCWTIRGERAARHATEAGVDGIISDDPQFCRR